MVELSQEEIGRRIADRREALDIKQGDLAVALGIGRSTMSQYETGKIDIKMPMLIKIARGLNNTPMPYFFGQMSLLDLMQEESSGNYKCPQSGNRLIVPKSSSDSSVTYSDEFTDDFIETIVRRVTDAVIAEIRTNRLPRPRT